MLKRFSGLRCTVEADAVVEPDGNSQESCAGTYAWPALAARRVCIVNLVFPSDRI